MENDLSFTGLLERLGSINDERLSTVNQSDKTSEEPLLSEFMKLFRQTEDNELKKSVIESLIIFKEISLTKTILTLIDDENDDGVKIQAIRFLGQKKDKLALSGLERIVNLSDSADVIQEASIAIQIIQGIAPEWSQDQI